MIPTSLKTYLLSLAECVVTVQNWRQSMFKQIHPHARLWIATVLVLGIFLIFNPRVQIMAHQPKGQVIAYYENEYQQSCIKIKFQYLVRHRAHQAIYPIQVFNFFNTNSILLYVQYIQYIFFKSRFLIILCFCVLLVVGYILLYIFIIYMYTYIV